MISIINNKKETISIRLIKHLKSEIRSGKFLNAILWANKFNNTNPEIVATLHKIADSYIEQLPEKLKAFVRARETLNNASEELKELIDRHNFGSEEIKIKQIKLVS